MDILERQDFIKIICPYFQIQVFELLNRLRLIKGKEFQIITRIKEKYRSSSRTLRGNLKALEYLDNLSKIDIKYSDRNPVHAKLIASDACATITSSNLIYTSLTRNFELGSAYFNKAKIRQVHELFDNLWDEPSFHSLELNSV